MSTVLAALRSGKKAIEEYGWTQGELGGSDRGYCAMGAIERQFMGDIVYMNTMHALWSVLPAGNYDESELSPHPIAQWNDADGRTKEEVLDLFDKAIAKEQEKE